MLHVIVSVESMRAIILTTHIVVMARILDDHVAMGNDGGRRASAIATVTATATADSETSSDPTVMASARYRAHTLKSVGMNNDKQ